MTFNDVAFSVSRAITNTISILSPGLAIKRKYAEDTFKSIRSYDVAKPNRFTRGKKITDGNANNELLGTGDIAKIRKISRDLCRNSALARCIKRALAGTVVGDGITLQARATDKNGVPLADFNKIVNRYWKIWMKRCDVRGKKSFGQFLRQAVDQYVETGEYILQKLYRDDPICGLRIGALDSDTLDHTLNKDNIVGGVELDNDWKPIKYYFKGDDKHIPAKVESTTLTVDQVIHSYIEERPGQTRGEPWLAPCALMLWSAHRALEAELYALEVQACLAVVYKSGSGGVGGKAFSGSQSADGTVDGAGNIVQKLSPASIIGLTNAEDITVVDPKRPGNSFAPFVDKIMEYVSSCMGVSYAKVTKDYSKGNFSSQRMGEQDVRRQCKQIQKMLDDDIIGNLYESFIRELILSGLVKAPDFEENKDLYLQREVSFQPFEYIQPLQDAEADQVKLNSKIYTLEEMLDGRDVEEHIAQLGKEAKLADKYGVALFQKELKVVNVGGGLIDDPGDKIPME